MLFVSNILIRGSDEEDPSECILKWASGRGELGTGLLLNRNNRDLCKIHYTEINTADPCDSLI